jgi:hypothetical protein
VRLSRYTSFISLSKSSDIRPSISILLLVDISSSNLAGARAFAFIQHERVSVYELGTADRQTPALRTVGCARCNNTKLPFCELSLFTERRERLFVELFRRKPHAIKQRSFVPKCAHGGMLQFTIYFTPCVFANVDRLGDGKNSFLVYFCLQQYI